MIQSGEASGEKQTTARRVSDDGIWFGARIWSHMDKSDATLAMHGRCIT